MTSTTPWPASSSRSRTSSAGFSELVPNIRAAEAAGCDINAIRGYLESREILAFLSAIKESGERASKIVKNMLGFIRRSSSDHIPDSLAELVDRTVAIAATDFNLKKKYDFRASRSFGNMSGTCPPSCAPRRKWNRWCTTC